MIPLKLPKDNSFTQEALLIESELIEGFSGREIKNAILDMLLTKADNINVGDYFTIKDLHLALEKRVESRKQLKIEENRILKEKIMRKLKEKAMESTAEEETDTASTESKCSSNAET